MAVTIFIPHTVPGLRGFCLERLVAKVQHTVYTCTAISCHSTSMYSYSPTYMYIPYASTKQLDC